MPEFLINGMRRAGDRLVREMIRQGFEDVSRSGVSTLRDQSLCEFIHNFSIL